MKGARPASTEEVFAVLQRGEELAQQTGDPRPWALAATCAYGGARLSEARTLRWRDLRSTRTDWFKGARFARGATKGQQEGRVVPFTAPWMRALVAVAEKRPLLAYGDAPVFYGSTWSTTWSRSAATRAMRSLLDDALGHDPLLSAHSLRKWFATTLRDAGKDVSVIGDLLGHQDPRTTRDYLARPSLTLLQSATETLPLPTPAELEINHG